MDSITDSAWVRPYEVEFRLPEALHALEEVLARYPFTPSRSQLSLTHRAENEPSIEEGVGTLFDFTKRQWISHERDYRHFHHDLKQTYFHELYQSMQEKTQGRIGRVRLMKLNPKSCYSMHRDPTMRYHFVLKTNPQAFFIFEEGRIFSLPADGRCFQVDTRRTHTAMNG